MLRRTDKEQNSALIVLFAGAHAKSKGGLAFWFVKKVEPGICPAGKAYEKVYQRKAYEPIPDTDNTDSPE